jgi:hypothetical protein
MKKIITIFSVLVALTFMAGPSYALVGMPDGVPGTNVLQPFFLVDMAGFATDEGLDTLIIITDVSRANNNIVEKNEGKLHLIIRDKKSGHKGDVDVNYSPGDVVTFSVRDMLKAYVGEFTDLPDLEYDLDGNGAPDTYVGYIEFEGTRIFSDGVVDNLIAQVYVVDLANGRAAGTNAVAREWAPAADGYDARQNNAGNFEVFTGSALSVSDYRERGAVIAPPGGDTALTLTPRWFLKDADATNYLFIWTSRNHGSDPLWSYEVQVYFWDADENKISTNLNLPYQLNIIDVRKQLPLTWTAQGGWYDIPCPLTATSDPLVYAEEWLAYSYQIAASPSAGLNWSGLFDVHRNIQDFTDHPSPG